MGLRPHRRRGMKMFLLLEVLFVHLEMVIFVELICSEQMMKNLNHQEIRDSGL